MNICTYVTAISRQPKQYAIAIEYGTKTYEILNKGSVAVLQVLNQKHTPLVNILGKKSGLMMDKHEYLQKQGWLTKWKNHRVLKDANAYLLLDPIDQYNTGSDHELFLFQARNYSTKSEHELLTFQELIQQNVIL